jgi:hypothetical protein
MNFEDFLRILYPKQDKYRIAAGHLLNAIAKNDNGLDGYELSKLCAEKSISRATMQKVFVSLRDLGIVDRRSMKYYLNSEFSSAMRRLGDAWRNMEKNKTFGFNENTLKVNF